MVKVKDVAKLIGLAAVFVLLGGADEGCKPKKQSSAKNKDGPPVEVTARQLHADYSANEVSADEKYRDRVLRVTGKVTAIKKDITDDAYVTLGTANEFESVHAHFADEKALGALKTGQKIVARCVGNNVVIGSPQLADCVLE